MTNALTALARRNLLPWTRRRPISAIRDEFEDWIERAMGDMGDGWEANQLAPPCDLSESDSNLTVRMDLPGVSTDNIDATDSKNCRLFHSKTSDHQGLF